MSGQMPLFASAPRIQLKIGNHTLGYAIGFNFNLAVDVQPIYQIGAYAPVALEPTFYNTVTGTIQIIRLSHKDARGAALIAADKVKDPMTGVVDSSTRAWDGTNDVAPAASATPTTVAAAPAANSPLGSPASLYAHLDPTTVMLTQLFDMDVYMSIATKVISEEKIKTEETAVELKYQQAAERKLVKWFTISGCRITSRNTNITFGQIVNEPVSFNGLLVTPEDSGFDLDSLIKDK